MICFNFLTVYGALILFYETLSVPTKKRGMHYKGKLGIYGHRCHLMETKNSKLGRPKGSKNRISLTEMDNVESEINEQSKQIVKRFSASIEKLIKCINSQLSNI